VLRGVALLFAVSIALPPLAWNLPTLWLALTLFGATSGALDVSMNSHGVAVEHLYGRPILSSFHAAFSAGALLGEGDPAVYRECVQLARLGWCALAVGTGQAVLDYVIPYVNDRVAFGEPISNRQAVAFAVANIAIELDGIRLATYRAAGRVDAGRDFARDVALARRLCRERGMAIGSEGVQLLGGHGYVKEHPAERWYRDLRAAGMIEGALLV